ncbi:hypothetical protein K502DRAFT_330531 [Neoconidiobolus thromboides FSU 785]|nr:hypothetical protein K502DRAFT_330531 [Neoconidiobolus thromboides FSU 785]
MYIMNIMDSLGNKVLQQSATDESDIGGIKVTEVNEFNDGGNLEFPLQYKGEDLLDKTRKKFVKLVKTHFITNKKWVKKLCKIFKFEPTNNVKSGSTHSNDMSNNNFGLALFLMSTGEYGTLDTDDADLSHGDDNGFNYQLCNSFKGVCICTNSICGKSINNEDLDQFIIDINSNTIYSSASETSIINNLRQIINSQDLLIKTLSEQVSKLSQDITLVNQNVEYQSRLLCNFQSQTNMVDCTGYHQISPINPFFDISNNQFDQIWQNNPYNTFNTTLNNPSSGLSNTQVDTLCQNTLPNTLDSMATNLSSHINNNQFGMYHQNNSYSTIFPTNPFFGPNSTQLNVTYQKNSFDAFDTMPLKPTSPGLYLDNSALRNIDKGFIQ